MYESKISASHSPGALSLGHRLASSHFQVENHVVRTAPHEPKSETDERCEVGKRRLKVQTEALSRILLAILIRKASKVSAMD